MTEQGEICRKVGFKKNYISTKGGKKYVGNEHAKN